MKDVLPLFLAPITRTLRIDQHSIEQQMSKNLLEGSGVLPSAHPARTIDRVNIRCATSIGISSSIGHALCAIGTCNILSIGLWGPVGW